MSAATLNKTAFNMAVEMLSRAEYSKSRLIRKLLSKGYGEEEVESAIERLEELRYLNDKDAVKTQFGFLYEGSRRSLKEIKYKLLRRGFTAEDIETVTPEDGEEREIRAALKSLGIKYRSAKEPDKMRAYLYRHGFSAGVCYAAVERFLEEQ